MQNLREQAELNNVPIIKPNIEKTILEYISAHNPRFVVEIGMAVWYSTLVIAKAIEHTGGTITTFEVSYPSYTEALSNFRKYNQIHNITAYNLDPLTIDLNNLFTNKKIDFLFIDAIKRDYLKFYEKLLPFLSEDGIVIFDNIFKFKDKLDSLYIYLEKNQINYQLFPMDGDGIMVIK